MDITSILNGIGIQSEALIAFIRVTVTLLLVALLAWLVYLIAKKWLARFIMKLAGKTKSNWDDLLFDQKFFNRLGVMLAAIVIRVSFATLEWEHLKLIQQLVDAWIILSAGLLISSILDGVNRIYESYPISRDRPIRIFIQLVMIFIWCAAAMIVISVFTGKSVVGLLAGLAGLTAVLMLIFQDSILGFVAGIQLSANHMVRIGDWIVMPSRGVDGDVIEIGLTTVKVQNFDKTITTVPTHKLVSESFTNWRGMEEAGGRRIKRSINIDVNSIHYLTEKEIAALKESKLLKNYMENKLAEVAEFNAHRGNLLDERRLTNVGTFREYLENWLENNPAIHQGMTHMVRQLQPGPTGLPLEIYCFAATTAWLDYERIQSDVFDHVYAVLELFSLKAYQYSGAVAAAEQ